MFWSSEKKPSSIGDVDNQDAVPEYHGPDPDDVEVSCPTHTTERKLVNKIDFHVIPFLCIMYLLAFLDRVNIGNANVFGLSKELQIDDGNKYNTALTIFFVPYIIFEIPSNIMLKKFKPNYWLGGNMFMFGVITMAQGFVKNYSGLLATRFFLGVFETGMFPGAFYLIGMWYKRTEAQRRYSFFFSSTTLAGAFGGLLASAIGKMDGIRGYSSWRWVFIIEGLLTVFVSVFFIFWLPTFPEESKWLKNDELAFVKARLRADQGKSGAERTITWKGVVRVFKDPKIFVGGFMYLGLIVPAYGYAYFSPTIISGYKYSPIQTQLHSVPPYAAAFALAMIIAYISDKTQHRFAFTIFPICVAIAGFGILMGNPPDTKAKYAGLVLVAMGCYAAMPVIVCWFNMNLGGHHRRSVGSAWQVAFGNIGGFIATYSFVTKEAPRYITGYSISIAFVCLSGLSCTIYYIMCLIANRKRDKQPVDLGLSEYEKTELGDLSPEYRYLL
ncbi:MFS general substrate transporter [Eremomyces bilateralis CBS 781.70]|uniref:MFS general substrate transporter n=1 Tax=Eremomyces bilateralis CBS 781.70 TaxID=1392243 RepID=A0A6G1FWL0_9PEZI|nr:MFS general substrate transporter [Eremomyces bilateralis CBS 781.70]KAF1810173.1 MFS general substrate transporter [Eremomyces bilateralis CBS 781.70]